MKQTLFGILVLMGFGLLLGWQRIDYVPLPSHFPASSYDFVKNPLSKAKIELGRALFYDPILSKDSSISCSSCHSPYNAFAHTDHALSHGIYDQIGNRNAPALFNLAWQSSFMWDGAINHLDVQALAPISDAKEMGESMANVVQKVQKKAFYPKLFYEVFGDSLVTGEHLLLAMSAFQLSLVSATAKYDSVQVQTATFTEQEKSGYALFKQHCNSCHSEPLFTNGKFADNGLPIDTSLNDMGKGGLTKNAADNLAFKIPSLRNLKYTYPYMHDGRFKRLYQVLGHYTEGIEKRSTLATTLKKPLVLQANEKTDLIAFLLTLNDQKFVFDTTHTFPKQLIGR